MVKGGWIKLYRKSIDNPLYNAEPFDKWHAWQDLLLMANHEPKEFYSKGQLIRLEAGQMVTSIKILAERWRWSENKVRRFLGTLNGSAMGTSNGTPNGTLITIVNWAQYQDGGTPNGTPDGTPNGTPDGTLTRNKEVRRREGHPRQYTEEELFAGLD